ncbi:hypothetical protein Tco_0541243 [Tanacetum coccineum]
MDNRDNRSRGGIGSDKFGKHVHEIGQLILHVLTLSLHVPHTASLALVGLDILPLIYLEFEEMELDSPELDKQEVETTELAAAALRDLLLAYYPIKHCQWWLETKFGRMCTTAK